MDAYQELYRISKILLSEVDDEQTAERLLRRVVDQTGAERGFIVVREQGGYEQKFEHRYDRAAVSAAERRFSRTLVREAIEKRQLVYLPNLIEDQRFSSAESTLLIGKCSVLVAPLFYADEVYGVVYLENHERDAFSAESRAFLEQFAEVAGLFMRRALERQALLERNRSLESDLFARHDFKGIVTRHPRMLQVLQFVAQVADADAPVLIQGETGTGKELIARAIHVNSGRRDRPLVTVHCSALPTQLIEAELFGHVAGAFTDAKRDRRGRLAGADGGTLFLDEIAEIPIAVQAKMLRFLQFGEIQRVGTDRVEKVDVRIVAATHRDLKGMIAADQFREDLYFRLKVLDVTLPPLRERRSDVSLLLESFMKRFWRRTEAPRRTPRALAALQAYDYPGNVRELMHVVERACLLATSPTLDLEALPAEVAGEAGERKAARPVFEKLTRDELNAVKEARVEEAEEEFLRALMERTGGNVSQAARESGIHRSHLQKLLARHRDALSDLMPAEA
jgi:Nif-specific regulatory protein/two-component system response regulator HydG